MSTQVTSILSETFSIIRKDSGLQDQAMENCDKKAIPKRGGYHYTNVFTLCFQQKTAIVIIGSFSLKTFEDGFGLL